MEIENNATELIAGRAFAASGNVRVDDYVEVRFADAVLNDGIPHVLSRRWPTAASGLDALLPYAVASERNEWSRTALLDAAPVVDCRCLVLVELRRGVVYLSVAADEAPALEAAEAWVRGELPPVEVSDDREIPVTFWAYGAHGGQSSSRRIAVPSWADIRSNYPLAVRERLDALLRPDFRPGAAGQLLLWHGVPGTGKTYALRALGWEWRDWCELHYVTDPEVFFGERTDYLVEVLLDEEVWEDDEPDEDERQPKWRLLVLEDTGELLAADAKERTGQGLSRLLNVVDGLIGQGLRILVLVTTNERLKALHPAVARPGRCLGTIEFVPFGAKEAAAWLAERGVEASQVPRGTLASLYAAAGGRQPEPRRPVGFEQLE